MSSRDTTANRSQPQRRVVVYETPDSSQATLGSRLDATNVYTTVQTVSDAVGLVDVLMESPPDCLVCQYSTEMPPEADAVFELLAQARPRLPRVAYVESTDGLRSAHEQGFSAVHLSREADDTEALVERLRAAIETSADETTTSPPPRLVAASVDEAGTVRRTVGDPNGEKADGQPLWTVPWAPPKKAIETAIDRASTDPNRPVTAESATDGGDLLVAADAVATASDDTKSTVGGNVTVLTAIPADADTDTTDSVVSGCPTSSTEPPPSSKPTPPNESMSSPDGDRTLDYGIIAELYRTLKATDGPVDERIGALLGVGQSYLDIDTGIVASVDDESYEIEHITSDDQKLGTLDEGDQFSLSDTFCERTVATGDTYSVTDVTSDDRDHGSRAVVSEFGACQYLGTPISVDGEPIGTLCFVGTSDRTEAFSPQDRLLTELIAQLVSYELQHHADKQEIKAAKSELTELFDRVDDAFYALDTDWQFTHVNEQAETLLQTEASTLLGRSIWDVFDYARRTELYDQFTKAVETGESTSFVVEVDSLNSWFDVTAYPSKNGLSVYFRDVTDRKQRTIELERYEQILETVSDGVYALDSTGHFTYVNEGLAELTGYSQSELVGSHVGICKDDSTVERAEKAVRERIRRLQADPTATDEVSLDVEIETADGQTVPCTDHIALLPFDDRFRGSVGTLRDVSAQREREQTLSGLLTVTRALMAAETPGDVADLVVEAVSEILGYDWAVVHLLDEESDRLLPEAATEVVHREVETLSPTVVGEGPIGSTFESSTASIYKPSEAAGAEYRATASLISVPLGEYGTLTVGANAPDEFVESDRQLIQLLTANAEEALNRTKRRQTLRRYEMILESVQEMMCVIDTTGRIKLLTDPLARQLDDDRSRLIGRGLTTFLAETDPKTGPLAALFGEESTSDITFKDSLLVGDEAVPVSVEASTLPHVEGRPEAVVTIHDISDLISAKEAAAAERERFTYLFENLTDPVDEIRIEDDHPTLKGVNSAFRSLFGESGTVDEPSIAEADTAPVALDDDRIVESEIQQSQSDEFLSEGEWELKLTTNEGTKYFLYRSVSYELGDDPGGFEIYTDITALKQREIQLQVLHRLLRHNLRNDLNVIEGFAEMLKSELDDEQHREFATRIHSNATQLAELSETAKTIESVAGHRSLDRRPIALDELVRSTVDSCGATYDEADFSLDELSEVMVSAGIHLETALAELIENAIEHNDAAVPQVSITVEVDDEFAAVTISDNGPGIPPEEWAVVTGDTEISQLEHGSGLGLWLVRWVTEGYGGELTYHEREPGSTISIRLPLMNADS